MVVDTDANLAIVEIMKGRNESIIDGIWVEKINSHHRKDHRLLVLTESSASLCRAKKASRIVTVSRNYQWFSITAVECPTPKVISLKFGPGEDLTFVCHSHTVILEHILTHLKDILHSSEMPSINCPGMNVDALMSVHNPLSALKRLRARIFCRATLMPDDLSTKFQHFLGTNAHELNMGAIPYGNFCREVLDAVVVEGRITSVVFPKSDVTHWREISSFLASAKGVRRFETMERMDSTFLTISEQQTWDSSIDELSFWCSKFSEHELNVIADLCVRGDIHVLEIHGAVNSKLATELCRGLQTSSVKALTLDGVEGLDIASDFEALKSLESLALVNCQIEISRMLSLMNCDGVNVKKLDLSMNKFEHPLPRSWRLPASIGSLTLDNIATSVQAFGPFLKILLRSAAPLALSLKNLGLGRAEVAELFDDIACRLAPLKEYNRYQIAELLWDGNYLCPSFFNLMDKCFPLSVLSLKSVVVNDTDVGNLAQFLANTCSVQTLTCPGGERQILPAKAITRLVGALRTNRSIKKIDISWAERSNAFLAELAEILMENRLVSTLVMKDKPIDEASIKTFLKKLSMRGAGLDVEVACVDKYDQDTRTLLATIAKGNASIPIPRESVKRTTKPVMVMYAVDKCPMNAVESAKEPTHKAPKSPFPEADAYVWALPPARTMPPTDNTKLLQELATQFSIHNILARMRKR